jgi:transcriptional regulator with XRE-family HTH domain
MSVEPQRFGEKLHQLRTYRQLSMQQLASLVGYSSHGYISELEAGKKLPTVELVLKLARLFDIPTDVLLKDELDFDFPIAGEPRE